MYRTKSASYLATRVLNQLTTDERKKFPLASAVALKDFYVDDVLSGAYNVSSALNLKQELNCLLKAGLTNDFSWHHVKTSENPTDTISLGMTPQQLLDNSLWWNGPQFLQQITVELIDTNDIPTDDDYLHELKKDKTLALSLDSTLLDSLLSISNNYSKLIRVDDVKLLLQGKQPAGISQMIFSANCKNFVNADSELKRLILIVTEHDDCLSNFLSEEGIQWKFLPPRAPNFDGLWEAGVKS
ncbi:hypothetical protein AVEN_28390-1 [Araneus ventricosus]|uniref:Uncharacterized protein n=1 Tax=Araneus ventricosus TaxID=182803 RepID=A0A4Y2QAD7_ARAVE|nr:hypothetical protein AVEN_28390-1 [Araneus ventricosus]